MKNLQFTKAFLVFLFFLVCNSCVEDHVDDESQMIDKDHLGEKGKAFVEMVQSTPGWGKIWNTILKKGKPVPDEVLGVYSPGYGAYLVLPITNEGEVTHAAFFPMSGSETRAGSDTPEIVGMNQTERPEFVKSFFAAKCPIAWEEKKLPVNPSLKGYEYNRLDVVTSGSGDEKLATRASGSIFSDTFSADMWVNFTYFDNGSVFESYSYRIDRIRERLITGFNSPPSWINPMNYQVPGRAYDIDIYTRWNSSEFDNYEIERHVKAYLDNAMLSVKGLYFVNRVWAIYRWSPLPNPTGGDFGGWQERPDVCQDCRQYSCECPELSVEVDFGGGNFLERPLLYPYEIKVIVKGKRKYDADVVSLQMTKNKYSEDWQSVGYGRLVDCSYSVTRKSFNPGIWKIRASCTLNDSDSVYCSSFKNVREFVPSIDDFKNNKTVTDFLVGLWNKGVAFAEANKSTHAVKEFGAFIFFNPNGTYSCVEVEPGPEVYLTKEGVAGSLELREADYADLTDWNNPNRMIPLVVGTLHTHYPLTWAKTGYGSDVGPSTVDNSISQPWPGLVYDYSKMVYGGDPVIIPGNPLKAWSYGPYRREY